VKTTEDPRSETRLAVAQHAKWALQSLGIVVHDDEALALAKQLLRLSVQPTSVPVKQ
jgi:hypothetical protein